MCIRCQYKRFGRQPSNPKFEESSRTEFSFHPCTIGTQFFHRHSLRKWIERFYPRSPSSYANERWTRIWRVGPITTTDESLECFSLSDRPICQVQFSLRQAFALQLISALDLCYVINENIYLVIVIRVIFWHENTQRVTGTHSCHMTIMRFITIPWTQFITCIPLLFLNRCSLWAFPLNYLWL